MRLHQILTGSCNGEVAHISMGTLGSFHFICYASGCDVVILNELFMRVQIIPGVKLGGTVVSAVSCNVNDGKVAIANSSGIYIYEPTLIPNGSVRVCLSGVMWCFRAFIDLSESSLISHLAWKFCFPVISKSQSCLLSASQDGTLLRWRPTSNLPVGFDGDVNMSAPVFHIGGSPSDCGSISSDTFSLKGSTCESSAQSTEKSWKSCHVGNLDGIPLQIEFSPDGRYVATLSEKRTNVTESPQRSVRVWFREMSNSCSTNVSSEPSEFEVWDYIVLTHSFSVVSFNWRGSSRYMPALWVPNVLITSSEDRVCRVWVEISFPSITVTQNSFRSGSVRPVEVSQLPIAVSFPSECTSFPWSLTNDLQKTDVDTDAKSQPSTVFPIPSDLFCHPFLSHLLNLWLADPFGSVQSKFDPECTQQRYRNGNDCEVLPPVPAYPRFTYVASLSSDGPHNSASDKDDISKGPLNFHWFNNKVYRFDEQVRSLVLGTVSRILSNPLSIVNNSEADTVEFVGLRDHIALLDQSLAALLGEWQHSPDVVLAVNPADGSLLVWYIHGLDACTPNPAGIHAEHVPFAQNGSRNYPAECSFTLTPNIGLRCMQVSSSLRSRLHEAFPSNEAASMLSRTFLFLTSISDSCFNLQPLRTESSCDQFASLDISMFFCRLLILCFSLHRPLTHSSLLPAETNYRRRLLSGIAETQLFWSSLESNVPRTPYVAMVTTHVNGSLRYWRLDVCERSHFQWIVGVTGSARLSGHRFHTESIVPHPILPLVLTSSHFSQKSSPLDGRVDAWRSEVILWHVGPVGPLTVSAGSSIPHFIRCHHSPDAKLLHSVGDVFSSGSVGCSFSQSGLSEVARVDVCKPELSHTWFNELAWFPCMLITSLTHHPAALFISNTDAPNNPATQLGFFLAFAEFGEGIIQLLNRTRADDLKLREPFERLVSLTNADTSGFLVQLRVVLPDSARSSQLFPSLGKPVSSETLLLHVFPAELIPGLKSDHATDPLTCAQGESCTYFVVRFVNNDFDPPVDQNNQPSKITTLEMWRVVVLTNTQFAQDSDNDGVGCLSSFDQLISEMEKICDWKLPLPTGVWITRAEVSAAHVSWAAMSPFDAPPPYLIVSACSDGCLRFWRCDPDYEIDMPSVGRFAWSEWRMPLTHALSSTIELDNSGPPQVLDIDCAYSGRVAVAYTPQGPKGPQVVSVGIKLPLVPQVLVSIYECESSGGCEWLLEGTIDLSHELYEHCIRPHRAKVPPVVQLDWVSTEDGGHLLSVMLGAHVLVYAAVCQNLLSNAVNQTCHHIPYTLMTSMGEVFLSWKLVATAHVHSGGAIEEEPTKFYQISHVQPLACGRQRRAVWLRDGLLLIGMLTEMHVYSQWPSEYSFRSSQTLDVDDVSKTTVAVTENTLNQYLPNNSDRRTSAEADAAVEVTVSGSASMTIARLTKTYSAYPLKPSPSTALLANLTSTATSPIVPMANRKPGSVETPSISNPSSTVVDPSLLVNLGLFESIQVFNPVLPQFHPRQLLEWMNLGRLRRVQVILAHLTRCLTASSPNSCTRNNPVSRATKSRRLRRRQASSNADLSPLYTDPIRHTGSTELADPRSVVSVEPGGSMCLLQAETIPPVPLYVLLAVDSLHSENPPVSSSSQQPPDFDHLNEVSSSFPNESELFRIQDDSDSTSDDSSNQLLNSIPKAKDNLTCKSPQLSCGAMSMWSLKPESLAKLMQFGPDDARLLAEYLQTRQLPGLSPLDQMYLLGIADLMAHTQSDVTERLSRLPCVHAPPEPSFKLSGENRGHRNQGLDECGLRFLLTVQLYSYLSRSLPPARRAQLLSSGLTNASLVWAFHSDAEEELLSRIPTKHFAGDRDELTWTEFRRYGCGWWIRSDALLRRCAEKIARNMFQATKDPMEAAVFYLAMRKAKVVGGLFKSVGNKKLESFFRSDFDPGLPACRQAKLNAFRLLSQHKYQQAAGLFLLAGCLDDAIRVCLDSVKDLQLAVVIARLYTSSFPGLDAHSEESSYRLLLRQHVVTHEDPFLRSIAFWVLGEPLRALQTLLQGPVSTNNPQSSSDQTSSPTVVPVGSTVNMTTGQNPQHPQSLGQRPSLAGSGTHTPKDEKAGFSVCPNVFKFYTFLRTHPLVLRQRRLNNIKYADRHALHRLACLERRLYFRTAHHYSALGCPSLALEVLSKLPALSTSQYPSCVDSASSQTPSHEWKAGRSVDENSPNVGKTRLSRSKADDECFAWSCEDAFEQLVRRTKGSELRLEWSDEEGGPSKPLSETASSRTPIERDEKGLIIEEDGGVVDLIANQLKFIACLKILSEELSTLAAGAESEGVGLRQHVWHWLEQEMAVIHSLTATRFPVDTGLQPKRLQSAFQLTSTVDSDKVLSTAVDPQFFLNDGPLTTPSFLLCTTPCSSGYGLVRTSTTALPDRAQTGSGVPAVAVISNNSGLSSELRTAEQERLRTRYEWLKFHESFLLSLINYCGLYGASGVGLPAVRIELLLLLTELYTCPIFPRQIRSVDVPPHESTSDDSSLIPSPIVALIDGIPLLRTILHLPPGSLLLRDPVRHVQCMIQDIMSCLETLPPPYLTTVILPLPLSQIVHEQTIECVSSSGVGRSAPFCVQCAWAPTPHRERQIFLLRNLCAALSACVHQILSTGGWFGSGQLMLADGMVELIALPASSSMTARSIERFLATKQPLKPVVEPSRWPGLTSLQKYIHTNNQALHPKAALSANTSSGGLRNISTSTASSLRSVNRRFLVGLLGQALAASYLGLMVYALHIRDPCALYRLASARLDGTTWARVFGGAYRSKPFRPPPPPSSRTASPDVRNGVAAQTSGSPSEERSSSSYRSSSPHLAERHRSGSESSSQLDVLTSGPPKRPTFPSLAREHALAAQHVAAQLPNVPSDKRTNQRIRLLTHVEASSMIATGPPLPNPARNLDSLDDTAVLTTRRAPSAPDEWFVPPQCSMLSCLLERPSTYGMQPGDPNLLYDSDSSETPKDYISYSKATTIRQRRIRRAVQNLQRQQLVDKGEIKRKMKGNSIHLAKCRDPVEGEDEDAFSQQRNLHATDTQPRWILRLLHLDPDMSDELFLNFDDLEPPQANPMDSCCSDPSSDGELDDHDISVNHQSARLVEREWSYGDSYSWRLMRLGMMQLAQTELARLTKLLDFGSDELAVHAPGLVTATRLVDKWLARYRLGLASPPAFTPQTLAHGVDSVPDSHFLPPPDFIPDVEPDLRVARSSVSPHSATCSDAGENNQRLSSDGATRAMLRLRHLMDPTKTPFQTRDPFSLPAKRLWCYLTHQSTLDDMFVRHIFRQPQLIQSTVVPTPITPSIIDRAGKSPSVPPTPGSKTLTDEELHGPTSAATRTTRTQPAQSPQPKISFRNSLLFDEAIRLVHKEQDPLIAMCVNQVNQGYIAIATPKEIIELDIDNLINLPLWFTNEVEYDCELMRKPHPRSYLDEMSGDDFVVIDSLNTNAVGGALERPRPVIASTTPSSVGSSSAHMMMKRTIGAVYCLASHSNLPYYLCGTDTGSVHLLEWASAIPVVASFTNTHLLTAAGASGHVPAGSRGARVTALHFDVTGRRFGCGDADGNFGLWNMHPTVSNKPPYFRCRCHAKGLADFCFVGSSSLIATAGNGGGSGGTAVGVSVTGQISGTESSSDGTTSTIGVEQDTAHLTLWDALLPARRCGVIHVMDPELDSPCTVIAHISPSVRTTGWPSSVYLNADVRTNADRTSAYPLGTANDRLVAVGTKRGDICFVDLRQPKILYKFTAHESAVRALRLDVATDCLITGGADGYVKVWRISEHELITSFCSDFYQGRGAAAVAALFRGNQSAAIIAATHPGIAEIHTLPLLRGASLLIGQPVMSSGKPTNSDITTYAAACRFLSCSADGGLRMRSLVVRPKPFGVY